MQGKCNWWMVKKFKGQDNGKKLVEIGAAFDIANYKKN
jgi:hypothetical protein